MVPPTCNAAVFLAPNKPLEIQQFEIPDVVEPGAALCRVRMSTICGSDLHTVHGRRTEPTPSILGHEIIGEVVVLGDGLERDGFGDPLKVGDRVTWSIMASCNDCFFCDRQLPQKCESLRKYGHLPCNDVPQLTGGYGEYIYIFPGTAIFRIPDSVSDSVATPANCALSTVIQAAEAVGIAEGETVLIQGGGMLGINLAAIAADAGAGKVLVTDVNDRRLELAAEFGGNCSLNVAQLGEDQVLARIRDETDGYGVDVAFEVCGAPAAFNQAISALRIGGRYLVAGLLTSDSELSLDAAQVTRKCLTIKGIHNYRQEHLGQAIRFLERRADEAPFEELVGRTRPLAEINDAIQDAASGDFVRVAIAYGD
jgi:alcohol dehydrogenase